MFLRARCRGAGAIAINLAFIVSIACSFEPTSQPAPDIEATVQAALSVALSTPVTVPPSLDESGNTQTRPEGKQVESTPLSHSEAPPSVATTSTPLPSSTALPQEIAGSDSIPTLAVPTQTPTQVQSTIEPTPPPSVGGVLRDVAASVRPTVVRIASSSSTGTGFIISSSGLIVTNEHVIGSDLAVEVTLYDSSTRAGIVLGTAKEEDIALIAIEGSDLATVQFGSLTDTGVGDEVFALGYALDLSLCQELWKFPSSSVYLQAAVLAN